MNLKTMFSIGALLLVGEVSAVETNPLNDQEEINQPIMTISQNSGQVRRPSSVNMTWREFRRNMPEGRIILCDGEIRMCSDELIRWDMNRSRLEFPNLFHLIITGWGDNEERTSQDLKNRLSILFSEGNFQNLSSFSYFGNILDLPAEIENLEHLTYMELLGADKLVLPKEIGKLEHLTRLILANSTITAIPAEVGNLKNLKILDLGEDNLTRFPNEIWRLSNLSLLDVPGNKFVRLPEEIGNLRYLNILNLSHNELVDLPEEMWNLVNLNVLNLSHNKLTSIPPEIENLTYLEDLDIRDNKLTTLPRELGFLEYLEFLAVNDNDFEEVPSNILELPLLKTLVINEDFLRYIRKDRIYSISMWNNEYTVRLDRLDLQPR